MGRFVGAFRLLGVAASVAVGCGGEPFSHPGSPEVWDTCDFPQGHASEHLENVGDAEVELRVVAIGEAVSSLTPGRDGEARVHLERRVSTVLVLSSEHPTHWVVTASAGTEIERVLLDGRGSVEAPAGVAVETLAAGPACGWNARGADCAAASLIARAELATGLPLAGWHGCQRGTEFAFYDAARE